MRSIFASLLSGLLLLATAGGASALSMTGMSVDWQNVTGGTNINYYEAYVGFGSHLESRAMWGESSYGSYIQSGLGFTAASTPAALELNQVFDLGILRHFNMPVLMDTAASALQLALDVFITDTAGFDQTLSLLVDFNIDETPNNGSSDADIVNFAAPDLASGANLVLKLVGFGTSPDNLVSEIATDEWWTSTTHMYGVITEGVVSAPVPTPEPATMVLASLGFGALAWARRRKN